MDTSVSKRIGIVFAAVVCAAAVSAAASAGHAVVGSIDKVDTAAKTIAIKTVDGTVEVVEFTEKTAVTGVKDVARVADLAGKGTYHFVVRYTDDGVRKTATALEYVGDGAWKAAKGTVVALDHAARMVVMKTADGVEWTFHAPAHAVVETRRGVEKLGAETGKGLAKGMEVTVHYTEEGGKKVAHFLRKAG
jgi:Cu/Ag efflux protein CusF